MKKSGVLFLIISVGFLLTGCFGPVVRPTADFTWCPNGWDGLLSYWFVSQSTTVPGHYITSVTWDFGDGVVLPDSYWEASHRFDEEGTYKVTLIVTDDRGVSETVTKDVPVIAVAVIREWELTPGWPVKVVGEVANRHDEPLDLVTIKAKFYNADGVRLTDGIVDISDLAPGECARFTVAAEASSNEILSASVFVESFVAECPQIPYPPIPVIDDATR
jgi:PKD repeat protein